MCLYPRLITNPKYKPNKKNGGKPPFPTDNRVTQVPIACGNCIECRKQTSRQWQIRLLEEIKTSKNGYFITLTFSDENIYTLQKDLPYKGYALDNQTATIATRRFLERWRKTHKKSLRHWFITELGHNGTNNIHIHGIIWFEQKEDILKLDQYWQYGFTWKGKPIYNKGQITGYENYVNEKTVGYITKYVHKTEEIYKTYKPVILTSPGIGAKYINRQDSKKNEYKGEDTKETYITNTGHRIALPIYYRNKLYTEEQKEQLWLQKLDKQQRFVLGVKIDISENQEQYLNALENAQIKNRSLGYGNRRIDFDQKKYELQIRQQMQQTRLIKGKQKT